MCHSALYCLFLFYNKGLRERVKDCEFSKIDNSEILPKLVIILPEDCYCPGSLGEVDPVLKFEGHIPFTATRAGHINRDYKHSVYSIQVNAKVNSSMICFSRIQFKQNLEQNYHY